MLTSIYLECSEPRFAESVLDVIREVGSCSCIDNDQLLMDILRRFVELVYLIANHELPGIKNLKRSSENHIETACWPWGQGRHLGARGILALK